MAVPILDADNCTGCAICEGECPTEAITMENDRPVFSDDKCTACNACVDACPNGALTAA